MKLLVDKDFSSSSLWVPGSQGIGWASCDHHSFDLPQELLDRCDYLSDWFETFEPGSNLPEPDWRSFSAYLEALAIDLKRYVGEATQIFIRHEGAIVEVTGSFAHMLCAPSQNAAHSEARAVDSKRGV